MAVQAQTARDQWFDPLWRLNNLYTIVDERGRRVPFRMNTAQDRFYREQHGRDIILKARQLGFTTLKCLEMLDACMFYPDISAGIIAHNLDDAHAFFDNKIKFPYDNLDEGIREANPAQKDREGSLKFRNNSGLRVGTSLRSGTLHYLLISEYGKSCAQYPKKAKEIRTGALNAIQPGLNVCIESTAEGREGDFYNKCQEAEKRLIMGREPTPMQFKFHFFPWHEDPKYVADPDGVTITSEMLDYFSELETKEKIILSAEQRAWYVQKEAEQFDEMKREFPSTSKEAFEAAVQGAYFARQMRQAREQSRICKIPVESGLVVNTFWDLGMNDLMTIWFHQQFGKEHRFVNYMQASGEGFAYYAREMDKWASANDVRFGQHFGPHDIEVRNLTDRAETRKEAAERVGIKFETVPAPQIKMDGITATRNVLGSCWFDENACAQGITHLDNYRKKWNDTTGSFMDQAVHDDASHGADGFQTFSLAKQREMIGTDEVWQDDYGTGGDGSWMGA